MHTYACTYIQNAYLHTYIHTFIHTQGSILGLILFLLYINDIHGCKIELFVDDVKVFWVHYIKSKSINVLQICLDKISDRPIKWQLPISYSKCYSVHLGVNPNTVYKFVDANIKAECDIKDIDVFVSNNVTNSIHCNKLVD